MSQSEIQRAQDSWQKLSEAQKESYKTRAKELNSKVLMTPMTSGRFNSLGMDLKIVEEEKTKLHQESIARKEEIQRIINNSFELGGKELKN